MQRKLWLLFLVVTVTVFKTGAQQPTVSDPTFLLASKITGQDYQLFVSLPAGYAANDTTKYPVLYVLDGNFMFPVINSFQRLLSEIRETREVIVVGIGYPATSILGSTTYRTPDYTPTRDTAFENMLLKQINQNVKTGGADKFLQALKTEIFPLVETKYRTKGRGIAGHSFGALFGTYVLLNEPAVFEKYLLSSVSLFWDNGVLLKKEQPVYQTGQQATNTHVFLSVGELEGFMDMIPSMKKLAGSLRDQKVLGLTIEERVLPNESHASAFITSFNQGMRVLYKNPASR